MKTTHSRAYHATKKDTTFLEDSRNSAISGKSDLTELLRKCTLPACSKPLEDWLTWESIGYPENITVPEYRIWPVEIFGDFLGPTGVQTLPVHVRGLTLLSEDEKRTCQHYPCRESVAAIESILNTNGPRKKLEVNKPQLALGIGRKLYKGYTCVQSWAEYHPSRLVKLLNSVRNRILGFAIAVDKEAPAAVRRKIAEAYEAYKDELIWTPH